MWVKVTFYGMNRQSIHFFLFNINNAFYPSTNLLYNKGMSINDVGTKGWRGGGHISN